MKKLLLALLLLAGCQTATPNIEVLGGMRNFSNNGPFEWNHTNGQVGGGLEAQYIAKDGFGPEVGFLFTKDTTLNPTYVNRDVTGTTSATSEIFLGLRKNWMLTQHWQPFVSGGVSLDLLEVSTDLVYNNVGKADNGLALAPYGTCGMNYLFNDHFSAGLMFRHTFWGSNQHIFITTPTTDSNALLFSIGYSL